MNDVNAQIQQHLQEIIKTTVVIPSEDQIAEKLKIIKDEMKALLGDDPKFFKSRIEELALSDEQIAKQLKMIEDSMKEFDPHHSNFRQFRFEINQLDNTCRVFWEIQEERLLKKLELELKAATEEELQDRLNQAKTAIQVQMKFKNCIALAPYRVAVTTIKAIQEEEKRRNM